MHPRTLRSEASPPIPAESGLGHRTEPEGQGGGCGQGLRESGMCVCVCVWGEDGEHVSLCICVCVCKKCGRCLMGICVWGEGWVQVCELVHVEGGLWMVLPPPWNHLGLLPTFYPCPTSSAPHFVDIVYRGLSGLGTQEEATGSSQGTRGSISLGK